MFFNKILEKKIFEKKEKALVLINKKVGITSHDEVNNLRKIFKTKKVGHSGTLDSKVTGLLVMGLGKGTKILEYMLLSKKVYLAEFIFHQEIEREKFEEVRKKFLGKIKQLPPVKSAVKREWREREIYDLEILEWDKKNRWARLKTSVERGTYIRKLAHDMGQEIGINIHMGDLKRIQVGVFNQNDNWITSEKLAEKMKRFFEAKCFLKKIFYYFDLKKYFYSLEDFFEREEKIQKIFIKKEALKYILAGNSVRWKNLEKRELAEKGLVSILFGKKVIGVGEVIEENLTDKNNEVEIVKIKKILY